MTASAYVFDERFMPAFRIDGRRRGRKERLFLLWPVQRFSPAKYNLNKLVEEARKCSGGRILVWCWGFACFGRQWWGRRDEQLAEQPDGDQLHI